MEATESVIKKIQALFNMAGRLANHDGASNEAEAQLAMAKAQELLTKYNLDMATINNAGKGEGREKRIVKNSAMYKWQQELWSQIASANFCWHFLTTQYEPYNKRVKNYDGTTRVEEAKRKVQRHRIVGRTSNVVAVELMGQYLCETIERVLPYANKDRLSKSALSWRQGCSDRLRTRIHDDYVKARAQDKTATAEGNATALTLRSIDDKEYEATYDFLYGEGAYAKSKAHYAKHVAESEERERQRAVELANETPAQKRAREKREAAEKKRSEAASRRFHKKLNERLNNTDWDAYQAGEKTGSEISLNRQISTTPTKLIQ